MRTDRPTTGRGWGGGWNVSSRRCQRLAVPCVLSSPPPPLPLGVTMVAPSVSLRIGAGFAVLATGSLGVVLPLALSTAHDGRAVPWLLRTKAFSAGVVLALALVHVINDAFASLTKLAHGAWHRPTRDWGPRWHSPLVSTPAGCCPLALTTGRGSDSLGGSVPPHQAPCMRTTPSPASLSAPASSSCS
jgi:hypothetical protein